MIDDEPGRGPDPTAGEAPLAAAESTRGGAGRRDQRPLAPTIILLLLAGGVLLAIGLWTGRDATRQATPTAAAPATLTVVEPADSATVTPPLEITFTTTAPLRITPMGWQAGRLHIHAIIDGAEVMPGALDIRALGDGRYRWRLRNVGPGPHQVRLVWARPDHRAIPEGASSDVPFTVTRQ